MKSQHSPLPSLQASVRGKHVSGHPPTYCLPGHQEGMAKKLSNKVLGVQRERQLMVALLWPSRSRKITIQSLQFLRWRLMPLTQSSPSSIYRTLHAYYEHLHRWCSNRKQAGNLRRELQLEDIKRYPWVIFFEFQFRQQQKARDGPDVDKWCILHYGKLWQ